MNYSEYPDLAARTEGSYGYLRCIWAFGRCEEPDGASPLSRDLLRQMRFQHAIIGLNTETAEVVDLFMPSTNCVRSREEFRLEVAKELGDIMWYTALMYRTLFAGHLVNRAFDQHCDRAQNLAFVVDGEEAAKRIAIETDKIASSFLKRLKNQMFYGTLPNDEQLIEWLAAIVLNVARLATSYGYTLNEILDLNIAKLRKKFPNGFNGVDAETKRHEVGHCGNESVSTQVITPSKGLVDTYPVIQITHETQPEPAVPQADLAARIKDLSAFDVAALEAAVQAIREIHESEDPQAAVAANTTRLNNLSSAVERLGWQPTREPEAFDGSSSLPPQPLS